MPKPSRPRTYTVVGQLCPSYAVARMTLDFLRRADPESAQDWGLAQIHTATAGEKPYELGKVALPPPPALLKRLEGLLADRAVQKTQAGRQALREVRAALKPRRS
jgi:hypothetical protein